MHSSFLFSQTPLNFAVERARKNLHNKNARKLSLTAAINFFRAMHFLNPKLLFFRRLLHSKAWRRRFSLKVLSTRSHYVLLLC